jgi:alanine dehydrogenase
MSLSPFKTVGIAREGESPENPGSYETRVAIVPEDAAVLVADGLEVFVEKGAGERMGFEDADYAAAGVTPQDTEAFYKDKDLIIKIKGPSMSSIPLMRRGSTMLCMYHLGAYPERTELMRKHEINVVAMEGIVDSPRKFDPEIVYSKVAMRESLIPFQNAGVLQHLDIRFIGWSHRLDGAIRRAGNRNTKSLAILSDDVTQDELDAVGPGALYFYDTSTFKDPHGILPYLKEQGCVMRDLEEFETKGGPKLVEKWYREHEPYEFGFRKIEALHDTGRAGARYGFKLLKEVTKKKIKGTHPVAVIVGYGNVGMGAIQECYEQGVRQIHVLTRVTSVPEKIEQWLKDADLIVNGAVLPPEFRGKKFLITKHHVSNVIAPGTVLIDLVGGSRNTRGSIENIMDNTFPADPYFIENGIAFSALWGWPMMGMARETCLRYSSQIVDVLLGEDRLIDGIGGLSASVRPALAIGPF